MEFFLKEYTFNQTILQSYSDYSRKVIALRKYNKNAILAKANPTSKSCEKFLLNSQLELKIELIPMLINVLRTQITTGPAREDFIIVGSYENWKKEEERLVLRTAAFGAKELLLQKKSVVLPDEDMVFTDDAETTTSFTPDEENIEWIDQFGCFYIKKTDNVEEMVKGLNVFYSNTTEATTVRTRKRKNVKKNKEMEIGEKKTKTKDNKTIIDDGEMCDDVECESIYLNSGSNSVYFKLLNNDEALLELAYFYEMCQLSLEDCILCYHEQMNESISITNQINFFSLLCDLDELKTVEHVLNKLIKRK